MLKILSSEFFLPTQKFRSLSILLSIHHNNDISQHGIASEVGISSGMVNGYIKNLNNDGLINITNKNKRDKHYRLSNNGEKLLMHHLMNCSAEIVQLYNRARVELISKLRPISCNDGTVKVTLYGASETCRLVISSLETFHNIQISAVVDNDPKKWGTSLAQHVIQQPEITGLIECDYIIISSFAKQDEIYEKIKSFAEQGVKIITLSSL